MYWRLVNIQTRHIQRGDTTEKGKSGESSSKAYSRAAIPISSNYYQMLRAAKKHKGRQVCESSVCINSKVKTRVLLEAETGVSGSGWQEIFRYSAVYTS